MSPAKGHQDGQEAAAHSVRGDAEGARPAEPGEMKTQRNFNVVRGDRSRNMRNSSNHNMFFLCAKVVKSWKTSPREPVELPS